MRFQGRNLSARANRAALAGMFLYAIAVLGCEATDHGLFAATLIGLGAALLANFKHSQRGHI